MILEQAYLSIDNRLRFSFLLMRIMIFVTCTIYLILGSLN